MAAAGVAQNGGASQRLAAWPSARIEGCARRAQNLWPSARIWPKKLWHPSDDPVHDNQGGLLMQWRTPKIVEIACGCEINAYFPADL
jgi:coenzyme PQQ precursor peptide PqqA